VITSDHPIASLQKQRLLIGLKDGQVDLLYISPLFSSSFSLLLFSSFSRLLLTRSLSLFLSFSVYLSSIHHPRVMWHVLSIYKVLPSDEELSMALEDRMVRKIQRRVRWRWAAQLRAALLRARHRGATLMQTRWRCWFWRQWFLTHMKKVRLAKMLQMLYRSGKGLASLSGTRVQVMAHNAVVLIQRIYRGRVGRRRVVAKKKFIAFVNEAAESVSISELSPGHVEDLCDTIDFFLKDYTRNLPMEVLTLLRCVFLMFNGTKPEIVTVDDNGTLVKRSIYPLSLGWHGARLLLKRKARFLRRVRGLLKLIQLPNALPLRFSPEALQMMTVVKETIRPRHFNGIELGSVCILKLLEYVGNLRSAFLVQDNFPEYFSMSLPQWFKRVIRMNMAYERACAEYQRARSARDTVFESKAMRLAQGKKWGDVAAASKKATRAYLDALKNRNSCHAELKIFVHRLEAAHALRMSRRREMEIAQRTGIIVSQRDLDAYLRNTRFPEDDEIKALQYILDEKTILHLDTMVDLQMLEQQENQQRNIRNFRGTYNVTHVMGLADTLGHADGETLILEGIWTTFLKKIGGYNLVPDLTGTELAEYQVIKKRVYDAIHTKHVCTAAIDTELKRMLYRSKRKAELIRDANFTEDWDAPTPLQLSSESTEDLNMCMRDLDVAQRMKQPKSAVQIGVNHVTPVVLIIDVRLPKATQAALKSRLELVNYVEAREPQDSSALITEVQALMDAGKHCFFFADRGIHAAARSIFMGSFVTMLASLIPRPEVFAVDGSDSLRIAHWNSHFAADQINVFKYNYHCSSDCSVLLGSARRMADTLKECLITSKQLEAQLAKEARQRAQQRELDARLKEFEAQEAVRAQEHKDFLWKELEMARLERHYQYVYQSYSLSLPSLYLDISSICIFYSSVLQTLTSILSSLL
jgi:hypothetical protein